MYMQVYSVYFERATEHMQVYVRTYVRTYVCMYVCTGVIVRTRALVYRLL